MSALIVQGTIKEVENKLYHVKELLNSRKMGGYPLLSQYEWWLYETRPDLGNVCPICHMHHGEVFLGNQIKATFPYMEYIGDHIIRPRTHLPDLYKFHGVPCHCEMRLLNPAEAFERQLHEEKLGVI